MNPNEFEISSGLFSKLYASGTQNSESDCFKRGEELEIGFLTSPRELCLAAFSSHPIPMCFRKKVWQSQPDLWGEKGLPAGSPNSLWVWVGQTQIQ